MSTSTPAVRSPTGINSFAFVLGSAPGGTRSWQGTIKFAAIHRRRADAAQVQQNFAAGVGATYFLLFDVSSLINMPQSYVMLPRASTTTTAICSIGRPSSAWIPPGRRRRRSR